MNALRHIRKSVFGLSQAEIAAIAEVSQGTVSKWENGEANPSRDEMAKIRAAAHERGFAWDDSWFFDVPAGVPQ
jgi:transcriptional regulator with XRE-family HTH domain